MKRRNRYGKSALITGLIALSCAVTLIYSYSDPSNPTGPLTHFIGKLLYVSTNQSVEPTMQPTGTFDISERNLRKLFTTLTVFLSCAAGLLAIFSSRKEQASLWYALAIAFSSAALSMISNLAGIIFMFICGFTCLYNRKWKMTQE